MSQSVPVTVVLLIPRCTSCLRLLTVPLVPSHWVLSPCATLAYSCWVAEAVFFLLTLRSSVCSVSSGCCNSVVSGLVLFSVPSVTQPCVSICGFLLFSLFLYLPLCLSLSLTPAHTHARTHTHVRRPTPNRKDAHPLSFSPSGLKQNRLRCT